MRVGNREGKHFPVKVSLRQGCITSPWLFKGYITSPWLFKEYITSPWLFNIFMDGVTRKMKAKVREQGARMVNEVRENGK